MFIRSSAEKRRIKLGLVTGMGIERQRWGAYREPWLRFRIAVIAFRPRSFSTRSDFISASP
jgi:hypothetical protein